MVDLFLHAGRKLVATVVGVAICFTWWSLTGDDDHLADMATEVPAVIFGGGGGTLVFEITTTDPAEFEGWFGRGNEGGGDSLGAAQELDVGTTRIETELPNDAAGDVFVELADPDEDAVLSWTVKLDHEVVIEETIRFSSEQDVYALQFAFDDLDQIRAARGR